MKTLIPRLIGLYLNVLGILAPKFAGRKGFIFFGRPFRTAINPKQQAFFDSAEKFTFEQDGNSVQGYKWGSGKTNVVFLHGWQSHTYRWKPYVEALSKDEYTIYSIDAPGHGLSSGNFLSAPLYSDVIETLVKKIGVVHTAVTHSFGSFSLIYTMYRVKSLPVNNYIFMAPPGEAQDFVNVFRKTLRLTDRTINLIIEEFVRRYDRTPDFYSAKNFAPAVSQRGLIIHDEDDAETSFNYAVELNDILQNSRIVATKGLGHNLKSASVVAEVTNFIKGSDEQINHERIFSNKENIATATAS